MNVVMDAAAIHGFLAREFPQALRFPFEIREVTASGVTLALPAGEAHLRPGGTVMGPTLMTLADTAMYLSLLAVLGPVALAFTTSLEIHFLRRASQGEVLAVTRLVKVGRRLAVGQVELRSQGLAEPIGLATVTYSLPDEV